jgi:hypothetical protein
MTSNFRSNGGSGRFIFFFFFVQKEWLWWEGLKAKYRFIVDLKSVVMILRKHEGAEST